MRIDKIVGTFYCQTALRLCLEARRLCEGGACQQVADICSYVSTLCPENGFETCRKESSICVRVASHCTIGKATEGCKMAKTACNEAKKLCPRNHVVNGS